MVSEGARIVPKTSAETKRLSKASREPFGTGYQTGRFREPLLSFAETETGRLIGGPLRIVSDAVLTSR
jgi:hypothetical protein